MAENDTAPKADEPSAAPRAPAPAADDRKEAPRGAAPPTSAPADLGSNGDAATVPGKPGDEAPAPARRGGRGWLLLVLLAVLAVAGWFGWQEYERLRGVEADAGAWRARATALEQRMDALQQRLDQSLEPLARQQRALGERLDDAASTNRVLREEVLAVAERAALLEESIARVAEQRLRGELLLRLNEAEFLLLMGAERLRLFADPSGAREAYRLADAALAGVDDPLVASVRETLAAEQRLLAEAGADPAARARGELDAIAGLLPGLPPRRAASDAAAGEPPSRLWSLLSQLVTVRRVDAGDAAVGDPALRDAGLAALALDLGIARAAAERADADAYGAALMRIESRVATLFDPGAEATSRLRQRLAAAAAIELVPQLPALGETLAELRALRAARSP